MNCQELHNKACSLFPLVLKRRKEKGEEKIEQQRRQPTKACGRTGLQLITAMQISFGTDLNLTTNTKYILILMPRGMMNSND